MTKQSTIPKTIITTTPTRRRRRRGRGRSPTPRQLNNTTTDTGFTSSSSKEIHINHENTTTEDDDYTSCYHEDDSDDDYLNNYHSHDYDSNASDDDASDSDSDSDSDSNSDDVNDSITEEDEDYHNKDNNNNYYSSTTQSSPTLPIFLQCILITIPLTILILYINQPDEMKVLFHSMVQQSSDRLLLWREQGEDAISIWNMMNKMNFLTTTTPMSYLYSLISFMLTAGNGDTGATTTTTTSTTAPKIYTLNDMNSITLDCLSYNALSLSSSIQQQQDQQQGSSSSNTNTNTNTKCRNILTKEMKEAFHKDGVIAIRGLLNTTTTTKHGKEEETSTTTTNDTPTLPSTSSTLLEELELSSRKVILKQLQEEWKKSNGANLALNGGIGGNGKQFYSTKMGAAFLFGNTTTTTTTNESGEGEGGDDDNDEMGGFRKVALNSILPQIASELMGLEMFSSTSFESEKHPNDDNHPNDDDNKNQKDTIHKNGDTIRMLRDVFLAKDDEAYICGWHVDDLGYWPSTPSSNGINAWIAIDDMPITTGGGFALAIGSHYESSSNKSWFKRAHEIVGSTLTNYYSSSTSSSSSSSSSSSKNNIEEEEEEDEHYGYYTTAKEMLNARGAGTCNLHNTDPDINLEIEKTKRIYDIQAGDVIFHTRWLWHRTVPFHRNIVRENKRLFQQVWKEKKDEWNKRRKENPNNAMKGEEKDLIFLLDGDNSPLLYRRYSVRYAPGNARLPRGYGTELSILFNSSNEGQTLDYVGENDGPWYPKCWPNSISEEETQSMRELTTTQLPIAEERRKERLKEMAPYLKEISRKQRANSISNTRREMLVTTGKESDSKSRVDSTNHGKNKDDIKEDL